MLELVPLKRDDAMAFVAAHHRHHGRPVSWLFGVGAARDGALVGVAMVGRPVARRLDDGWTAEVIRLCVLEDEKNVCSKLYAACWRACRAIGYRRLVTYILSTEPGTSLRAAGWRQVVVGEVGGGTWSRASRPRVDKHPTQAKLRFEIGQESGSESGLTARDTNFARITVMWLRERAKELRKAAGRAERAYSTPVPRSYCLRVANAYNRAAMVLDDEADSIEESNTEPLDSA